MKSRISRAVLLLLSSSLALWAPTSFGQSLPALSASIDSMAATDQLWREKHTEAVNKHEDSASLAAISRRISLTDSANLGRLRAIIAQHGYPGYNLVGKQSSFNFWLLVQHADRVPGFQDSVLTLMESAVEQKDASAANYAYLRDRVCVNTGKPQIYGTQMRVNKARTSFEPQPVSDSARLNERRKSVGLESIEDYIKEMNERFKGALRQQ